MRTGSGKHLAIEETSLVREQGLTGRLICIATCCERQIESGGLRAREAEGEDEEARG